MILVACAAFFRSHSESDRTAPYVHGVRMPVIALPRIISLRMAVHAARVPQYRNKRGEERSIVTRSSGSIFGRVQPFRRGRGMREPECSGEAQHNQARQTKSNHDVQALHTASVSRMGNRRIRFPVTANTAFAMAGAAHGTPGSPIPPGFSLFSTM